MHQKVLQWILVAVHVQSFCHIPFLHKFLQDPARSVFEISQFDEQLLNNRTAYETPLKQHYKTNLTQTTYEDKNTYTQI